MTPEESLELLREAHREPVDEAHFAAVRARVLGEIAAGRSGKRKVWWLALAGLAAAVLVAGLWVKTPAPSRVARNQTGASLAGPERREPPNTTRTILQVPSAPRRAGRKPAGRAERPAQQGIVGPRISQPLVVKMVTDDPNVVIYWITEGTGE